MKRVLALGAGLSLFVNLLPTDASAGCEAGRIFSVSGSVLIRYLKDPTLPARVARVGDCVMRGSVINSASNGRAKLLLEDRSVIDIGGSTSYHFEEMKTGPKGTLETRDVAMSVDYGKIRASVNAPITGSGRFKVRTRAATMGVRGTEFVVDAGSPLVPADSASSTVTVMSGKVETQTLARDATGKGSLAAPVSLTAGMQASVSLAPQTLPSGAPPAGGVTTAGGSAPAPGMANTPEVSGAVVPKDSGTSPTNRVTVQMLSPEQTSATLQTASVKDETFTDSVVIEAVEGSSQEMASGGTDTQDAAAPVKAAAAESTLALVSETVVQQQADTQAQASTAPLLQDLGIGGTFTTENVVESTRPTDLNVAQPYNVRVILRIPNQ